MKNVEMRLDNASMTEPQRIEPTFEGVKVRNPDLARPMLCPLGQARTGLGFDQGDEVRVHADGEGGGYRQPKLLELLTEKETKSEKTSGPIFSISDDNAISRALVGRVFTWYWQNCGPRGFFDQIALDNP